MRQRLTLRIGMYAVLVLGCGMRASAQPPAAAQQVVLTKYCSVCHNEKLKSGGLVLTALDISAPAKNSESWEKVIRKLGTGAMPPAGMPRPDKAAADGLRLYLETELDSAALKQP